MKVDNLKPSTDKNKEKKTLKTSYRHRQHHQAYCRYLGDKGKEQQVRELMEEWLETAQI